MLCKKNPGTIFNIRVAAQTDADMERLSLMIPLHMIIPSQVCIRRSYFPFGMPAAFVRGTTSLIMLVDNRIYERVIADQGELMRALRMSLKTVESALDVPENYLIVPV